ncbi:MAG: biotin/lipoyl-binding protein [Lachnospiraceae bacterium]|nr:biotin/lipoyl-binding protein [Lachnospiraceae bacterium]
MKKKKIIIIVLVVVLVCAAIAGGILFFRAHQKNSLVADVESVSMLNWGYWGDSLESYGTIRNDDSQDIYISMQQTVKEIFVEEGQQVSAGDPLIQYDMTQVELQVEMQRLQVQTIENSIVVAQRELEKLKNTTPVPNTPPAPADPMPAPVEPSVPEKTGDAYNYVSQTAVAYDGDGSSESPLRFLCTQDAYVYGSFLNYLMANGLTASFEVRDGDTVSGAIVTAWTVNGMLLEEREPESKWYIVDGSQVVDDDIYLDDIQPDDIMDIGYTAEELTKAISRKEEEIKELDLQKRMAQLSLQQLENQSADGMVYAKIDGIVTKLGDLNNLPNDGSAFLSVAGSEGMYVQGSISELALDKVSVGQTVTVMSWSSGMFSEATITQINDYPEEDGYGYSGNGNPNASYYSYMAYIEDSSAFTNGEGVSLTIQTAVDESDMETIFIEKAYVRQEGGRSYCLKEDETGHLVKQYVTTGRTLYGSAIEIKSGLTMEDYIAFPYGKAAKEGVRTSRSDDTMVEVY